MSDETQAPDMIWLQDAGGYAAAAQCGDVTWCADQVDDADTAYIRHDRTALLASPIVQEMMREARVEENMRVLDDITARIRKGD